MGGLQIAGAVEPVVAEVDTEQTGEPDRPSRAIELEQRETLADQLVAGEERRLGEHADHLLDRPAGEIVQRVVQPLEPPPLPPLVGARTSDRLLSLRPARSFGDLLDAPPRYAPAVAGALSRFYERFVLPRAVDFTCGRRQQLRQRQGVVPAAAGIVLEVGFGTGLNLAFYDPDRVDRLLALEPGDGMWTLARRRIAASAVPVERLAESAERMPLEARSVDCVVVTYTLCTVPDAASAIAEMRRVLRPGGRLLFCEHGAAPEERVRRWQRRLDPLWGLVSGGCHLGRPVPDLLQCGGFRVVALEARYLRGWRPASYNFRGVAEPA